MDFKEKYERLIEEYEALVVENKRLRGKLNMPERTYFSDENKMEVEKSGLVTMQSASSRKIAFFRALFKGREDVYAKRWQNSKTGKSGYSPVCANEWDYALCNKRAHKCIDCPNRKYLKIDDSVIEGHLSGLGDVVGVYPLTEGDLCCFLAIDFDGQHWQDDVTAVADVCREQNISVSVERSRSGNGGHVWFFFEDPCAASLARKFGSALLTLAMERRHQIELSSYDRLFPNQDCIPHGGFGNLIALPLQGKARREGNSVFVDGNFVLYPDQWAYLSSVKKTDEQQIKNVIRNCGSDIGELNEGGESESKTKIGPNLTAFDLPETVAVTLSDMVYIDKNGISEVALNKIRRLAAFANPDFYKAQKMRLPVYNKPRIISVYEETDNYLAIPRGCLDDFKALINGLNSNVALTDNRNCGFAIKAEFNGQLRGEQVAAFEAMTASDTGVLCATTAFGKTVIGAKLIAHKKVNSLVLVHSAALLNQWKQALSKFLILENELPDQPVKRGRKREQSRIGQLGATKNTLNGFVDIAIMQSLVSGGDVKELVKDYGLVIVDECHHVPAVSFESVMKNVRAKYVYGLTATPQRQDGHQKIIYFECGDIRYKVDAKQQAKLSGFERLAVPRFTFFRSPLKVGKPSLQQTLKYIGESPTRNSLILSDIIKAAKDGRNILVLTERRVHAELLEKSLNEAGLITVLLIGTDSAKAKREKLADIAARGSDERFVIVATGKYIGEGFDFARLDTLFLTMPISWKGKLAQYVGRLHRQYEGKKEVVVYDYVDVNVAMLENMYRKRVAGYRSLGYEIQAEEDGKRNGLLFDKFNYQQVFYEDVLLAKKSIIIVCPKLSGSFTEKFIAQTQLIADKIDITVVTTADEANGTCIKKLNDTGISVNCVSELNNKYAVIDGILIWYGSISYLSYSLADDTALRFESPETAKALKNIIS